MERVSCEIPVPVFADTQTGLAEFLDCLRYVWEILDSAFLAIVERKLQRICFSDREAFVDPERTAAAITRNLNHGCSEILFWNQAVIGSDRHCKNVIAHELRHAWQFATNWKDSPEAHKNAIRILWELDAVQFAAQQVGKESHFCQLQAASLPTDDSFDRLVDYWPWLDDNDRLDVLQLAAGLAMDRKASLKFKG